MSGFNWKLASYSIGVFFVLFFVLGSPSLAQREPDGDEISGQSSGGGKGNLFGNLFGSDDPCQAYRDRLSASDDYFSKDIVSQFMKDIVKSGLNILMGRRTVEQTFKLSLHRAGAALQKNVQSYLDAKLDSGVSRNDMAASINADARQDQQEIQRARAAARQLTQCRQQQIAKLESDYRAGRINRDELIEGLEDVSRATESDDRLKQEVLGNSRERIDTFASASAVVQDVSTEQVLGNAATWAPAPSHAGNPGTSQGSDLLYTTGKTVNVRTRPSTEGAKVGKILPNEFVKAVGRSLDGQWLQIRYGSGNAFVYAAMFQCVSWAGGAPCSPGDAVYAGSPKLTSGGGTAPPPAQNEVQAAMIEQKQAESERQAQLSELDAELAELEILSKT